MKRKYTTFKIDEDLLTDMKVHCAITKQTMSDYISILIKKDLDNKKSTCL